MRTDTITVHVWATPIDTSNPTWREDGWYCQHSYEFCNYCFSGADHPRDEYLSRNEFEHQEHMTAYVGTTEAANSYATRVLYFTPENRKSYVSILIPAMTGGEPHRFVAWNLNDKCEPILHDISDVPMLTCPTCNNDHHYRTVIADQCDYSYHF